MNTDTVEYGNYSTILFIDSMIPLEAQPLSELPWHEIDKDGPILLLVVPQVNQEVDKRKRDGRLGKRAREFNRLITPAAESGGTAKVFDGPPSVDIAIAVCDQPDWESLSNLDRDDGDARVVAQVLSDQNVPLSRRTILTHDVNPLAMARRHGIQTIKLPDHWLLPPEPSPHEKEVTKLKAKVRELETNSPEFQLTVDFITADPLRIFKVHPLGSEEKIRLISMVLRQNKKVYQDTRFTIPGISYDSNYNGNYELYRSRTVPKYADRLHKFLEIQYGQITFELSLRNTGNIQAENLFIKLRSHGGKLHNKFLAAPIFGPVAPKPDPNSFLPHIPNFEMPMVAKANRHDVSFYENPAFAPYIEAHCEDFRHGSSWIFNGFAWIDPEGQSPFLLDVEVTCGNLRGTKESQFTLNFSVEEAHPFDLINIDSGEYLSPFPMKDFVMKMFDQQYYDFMEFLRVDDYESHG